MGAQMYQLLQSFFFFFFLTFIYLFLNKLISNDDNEMSFFGYTSCLTLKGNDLR